MVKIPSQKGHVKKIYAKDGEFHKEIELKWDKHEKAFILTKRNVSGKNSQGHSMSFSDQELGYLKDIFQDVL
jgi:hypothetical protein